MSTATRLALALMVVALPARGARAESQAEPPQGFMHKLAEDFAARIAADRVPQLAPPVPIAVTWRPQKLAPSLDLGAPLLALVAGDLDGDGKAELYAVTPREVIAFAVNGGHVRELGRVAFAGDPVKRQPRDPVGTAIVIGKHVIASSSAANRTLEVGWRGHTLVGDAGKPGFALCAGEVAQLAPGRDYFGDGATASYGWRCRTDLASPDGHPLHVRAQLSVAGKLDVAVERCELGGTTCTHDGDYTFPHAGIGFEITDLDRDGRPEVVIGGAGAPGEPDELRVVTLGDEERKAKLRKSFTAGGIAGIAVGDLDGHGAPIIVAAVRLAGSTRVDLWRMN